MNDQGQWYDPKVSIGTVLSMVNFSLIDIFCRVDVEQIDENYRFLLLIIREEVKLSSFMLSQPITQINAMQYTPTKFTYTFYMYHPAL